MVVYEKIYFAAHTNEQYLTLHWNFSRIPKDAPDIHRFSNRKWVLTMCTTGNL